LQRYVEAKRLSGLEIDHELELDRDLDGKLTRLRALEDAISIGRRAPRSQVVSYPFVESFGQIAPTL